MRALLLVGCLLVSATTHSQDTISTMPRYDRFTRLQKELSGAIVSGAITPEWSDASDQFTFTFADKQHRVTVSPFRDEISGEANTKTSRRPRRAGPERGRQYDIAESPDKTSRAVCRDRNVFIIRGKKELQITTEGSEAQRIKYGVASWVYGEELGVKEAMWWSPTSTYLAYYRFDEKDVKDYFLAVNQGAIQATLDTEPYPKAGAPNPKVSLHVYDVSTGHSTVVDVAADKPELGEYVYDVEWSASGKELYFNRTNRKQNVMQFCAADPVTGKIRVIAQEEQPQSWAANHPTRKFLKDGQRFIWSTEKNGYKNFSLRSIDGKELAALTQNTFDALDGVAVDEEAGFVYYTSTGTENPYFTQLHRVKLDGTGDQLLTDPKLHHQVTLSPDQKWFVDVAQSPNQPAVSYLVETASQKRVATLATSDISKFEKLGLKPTEVFTFTAADGKTTCYGTLQFPSDFNPKKKYPVLLSVYGGPESGGIAPQFRAPMPPTEFGFIMVNIAGRGTTSRGKAFRDAVYGKLGHVEIDDQAAGIRSLGDRPYIDLKRVGVFGTSYGGYSTIMLVLRHPDLFKVGCASSSVTQWKNYDSVYTERFMGLPYPDDNQVGYEESAAMKYVGQLKGKLMLYFGSSDNNVHPSNTYQLAQALENAGKSYDMQVGTDKGHTQMNASRMWEYFITHLILPEKSKR